MMIEDIESRIIQSMNDMEISNKFIIDLNDELFELECQLNDLEFNIRMTTDWKSVGCSNKEERELYVKNNPKIVSIIAKKRDLEHQINEYKHMYSVADRNLKFANRLFDYYSKIENCRNFKKGDNCGCR